MTNKQLLKFIDKRIKSELHNMKITYLFHQEAKAMNFKEIIKSTMEFIIISDKFIEELEKEKKDILKKI